MQSPLRSIRETFADELGPLDYSYIWQNISTMETTTIKWLDVSELRILKQIILVSDRNNNEVELGSLFYTRPLSEDYSLIKQQQDDEKTADTLSKFLQEYPKQKNYPEDEIDVMILNAIKRQYPKSIVRNDTIFFNVDIEKLRILKNRNVIKSTIYFSPEFSHISNIHEYVGKEFKAPEIDIAIYSYYNPESLQGQLFYANYDITNPTILDKLATAYFE